MAVCFRLIQLMCLTIGPYGDDDCGSAHLQLILVPIQFAVYAAQFIKSALLQPSQCPYGFAVLIQVAFLFHIDSLTSQLVVGHFLS